MMHNNAELGRTTERIFNNKTGESLGNEIQDVIQPIVDVSPLTDWIEFQNLGASTTGVIQAAETGCDFYVHGCWLSIEGDVLSTVSICQIFTTINGKVKYLARIASNGVAQVRNQVLPVVFPRPVKIDQGAAITLSLTFGAGTVSCTGCVYGYRTPFTKSP